MSAPPPWATPAGASSRRSGVWEAIAPAAGVIRSIHVSDAGRFGFARLEAREQGIEAFGYVVPNRALGAALWERLARRAGADAACPRAAQRPCDRCRRRAPRGERARERPGARSGRASWSPPTGHTRRCALRRASAREVEDYGAGGAGRQRRDRPAARGPRLRALHPERAARGTAARRRGAGGHLGLQPRARRAPARPRGRRLPGRAAERLRLARRTLHARGPSRRLSVEAHAGRGRPWARAPC